MADDEGPSLGGRLGRYARVGASVGGLAARLAGERYLGWTLDRNKHAAELKSALGGLKGPLMKAAQLLATIPDALPPEYARELAQLQANAPAMGWAFVKRRMATELGPDWQAKFQKFDKEASFAASLGQVHHAILPANHPLGGREVAAKLQYPDMASALEADLDQLKVVFAIGQRFDPAIRTDEIQAEIRTRLREELDYRREARHVALYRHMQRDEPNVHVPETVPDYRPAADHELAPGRASPELERAQPGRARRARHQHVPRLVRAVLFLRRDPRRPASRQLQRPARRLGQPDGLRLRARLSVTFRPRLDRALSRLVERRPRPGRWGLRGLGIYRAESRHDRRAESLGRVSLRPLDGRPTAPPDRGPGRRPRPRHGAERVRRAAPPGRRAAAARVRVHGSRRDRAGRGVHPPARLYQLAPRVREPDRQLRRRCAGVPPASRPPPSGAVDEHLRDGLVVLAGPGPRAAAEARRAHGDRPRPGAGPAHRRRRHGRGPRPGAQDH